MKKLLVLFCIINSIFLIGQTNYVKTINISNSLVPSTSAPAGDERLQRTFSLDSDIYLMEDHNHLVKIDSNYNVIYSKTFGFPLTTNSYSRIAGLTRVTNNRLAMCSQAKLNNNLVSNITFVNSTNGNIIWSKTIDSIAAMTIKYKNNKISVFACLNNYNYIINIDTNGNLINTKKINLDYNNPLPGPPSIYSYSLSAGDIGKDSSFFLLSSTPSYTNCGFKVTKLDKNENLVWSYEYKTNQNNDLYNNTILATQDGGVLVHFLHIGILYKINKFGKLMWQNYLGTIDRQLLFEKPDGQIFTYSEDGHLKLFDQNGNCLLYKLTYCVPKQQRRITAFFPTHFIFIMGVYNSPPIYPCFNFPIGAPFNALLYKNDYSLSGCGFYTQTITPNNTTAPIKGDSSISFHPYTPSLTPLSYSISSQTPTITITNDACNPAGIKENALNGQASIYPNPSSENLTITTKNSDIRIVSIINSIGQHITTIILKGDRETIDISGFATGLYFINCYSLNNELIGVQKIIKN